MKPRERMAIAQTPDGGKMELWRHDGEYSIRVNGQDLMNSRQHESELELARLGCARLAGHKAPSILVGGLGMGYTLREVLDRVGPAANVMVSELVQAVTDWNREFLGELNGQPLSDPRVTLQSGNVIDLIAASAKTYDAILLDVDNGPSAFTDAGNKRLYGRAGMQACYRALRGKGCLAIWSSEPSKSFERLLMGCNFHVRRYRVPVYKGAKSQTCFVWLASADEKTLPPGGGEPTPALPKVGRRASSAKSMKRPRARL